MSTALEIPIASAPLPAVGPAPALHSAAPLVTPQDLLTMSDEKDYELVDGQLVERNVSKLSSLVGTRLAARLTIHVEPLACGWVFGADLGYRCFPGHPDKVRKPDVSFVRLDRMPADHIGEGYATIAPDLAVEVISPNDLALEIETKIREYLAAGTALVWVVYPETRTCQVYRADGSGFSLGEGGFLEGESVLPEFRVRLGDLFPPPVVEPAPSPESA